MEREQRNSVGKEQGVFSLFRCAVKLASKIFIPVFPLITFVYLAVGGYLLWNRADLTNPDFRRDLLFLGMFVFLIEIYLYGVVLRVAAHYDLQREPSLLESIGVTLQRYWKLLLATLIAAILVASGLTLMVVPGIILAVFFLAYAPLIMVEGTGFIASLFGSMALVYRHWFHAFCVLFWYFVLICIFMLTMLVTVRQLPLYVSFTMHWVFYYWVVGIFSPCLFYLLYRDLKVRRQAENAVDMV